MRLPTGKIDDAYVSGFRDVTSFYRQMIDTKGLLHAAKYASDFTDKLDPLHATLLLYIKNTEKDLGNGVDTLEIMKDVASARHALFNGSGEITVDTLVDYQTKPQKRIVTDFAVNGYTTKRLATRMLIALSGGHPGKLPKLKTFKKVGDDETYVRREAFMATLSKVKSISQIVKGIEY